MSRYDLAAWFDSPVDVNTPDKEEIRDEILNDCYDLEYWGAQKGLVIIQGKKYRIIIEKHQENDNVMQFDAVKHQQWQRYRFWMNKSSLTGLRQKMTDDKRLDFNTLFSAVISGSVEHE